MPPNLSFSGWALEKTADGLNYYPQAVFAGRMSAIETSGSGGDTIQGKQIMQ